MKMTQTQWDKTHADFKATINGTKFRLTAEGLEPVEIVLYPEVAPVVGRVVLSGDVICDELEPTVSTDPNDRWPVTRWLRVVKDSPENEDHGTYKAGHILTLRAGLSDKDVVAV